MVVFAFQEVVMFEVQHERMSIKSKEFETFGRFEFQMQFASTNGLDDVLPPATDDAKWDHLLQREVPKDQGQTLVGQMVDVHFVHCFASLHLHRSVLLFSER